MSNRALLVKDGTAHGVDIPLGDSKEQLKRMKELLDVSILQAVILTDGMAMWVDEEGIFKEDMERQLITYARGDKVILSEEVIGAALFTGFDEKGETLGLTIEQQSLLDAGLQFRVVE